MNAEDFKNSVEDLNEKDYEQGGKYHGKRFFRSSRFLFTYKTRIPKDQLQQFFQAKSKNHPIKYCWIAHEAHPDQVTHAVVIWETLLNYTSCRYFDYEVKGQETIHPHVQQIKPGNENLGRVLLYVSKEDEDNRPFKKVAAEFLWGKARKSRKRQKLFLANMEKAQSEWEAYHLCDNYQQMMLVQRLLAARKPPKVERPLAIQSVQDLVGWEQKAYELHQLPPDRRLEQFIVDPIGCFGKNQFCWFMENNSLEKFYTYRIFPV